MVRRSTWVTRALVMFFGALVLAAGGWWQSRAAAESPRVGIHHFPPTTLTAGDGYRLVFGNTGGGSKFQGGCQGVAGFVDASGKVINQERFALRPGESTTVNMEGLRFDAPTTLVRAVLSDQPAGCLSATSEVTMGQVICWIVPPSSFEVR